MDIVSTLRILLAATFIFISYSLGSNFFNPTLRKIPGPFLARFSNLWRFVQSCKGRYELTVLDVHRRYGPVVRIGPNVVSIADPAAVEQILGFHNNLSKSGQVKSMENAYKGEPLPMLVSAMDSKLHAKMRRPIAGSYSMTSILGFEDAADECISKMIQQFETRFLGSGKACSIDQWMHYLAFDFIGLATFSKPFGFLDTGTDVDSMIRIGSVAAFYIAIVGNMPWLDYLFLKNPILLALVETPNPLVELASKCIKERHAEGDELPTSGTKDFLSRFLDAQRADPEGVSDLKVAAYTATNVLAASDTTGSALSSIIWSLISHQHVVEKLQREIDDADVSYPVPFKRAQTLPYLDAVIKEALRVFPTAGLTLERVVGPDGLTIPSGHIFAPGTILGVHVWPLGRAEVFGDDADSFVPERWLRAEGEAAEDFDKRSRRMMNAWLEFGTGPRGCLGKNVASIEIYKTIATLFGLFDVSVIQTYAWQHMG